MPRTGSSRKTSFTGPPFLDAVARLQATCSGPAYRDRFSSSCPRPHLLSGQLRRLAPALRRTGVEVEFSRVGRARTRAIVVRTGPEFSVPSVRERPHGSDADAADAADADFPTESNVTERELGGPGYAMLLDRAFTEGHITEAELRSTLALNSLVSRARKEAAAA